HNLTALLAAGVATVWVAYLLVGRGGARFAGTARIAAAGAIALGLTAFFWLPAATEGSAVQLEWLHDGDLRYENWLLDLGGDTPRQQSPYNRQTRPGPIDLHLLYPHQLVASPKVSLGQATAAAVAALSLAGAGAVALRRRSARSTAKRGSGSPAGSTNIRTAGGVVGDNSRRLSGALMGAVEPALHAPMNPRQTSPWPTPLSGAATLPFWIVAIVCWAMTFTFSAPVWEGVPRLTLLQFPWRLLGPLGMCLAIAIPGSLAAPLRAVERWAYRRGQGAQGGRAAGWAIIAVFAAGIAVNGAGDRTLPHDDIDRAARTVDSTTVVLDERRDPKTVGTTSGREFLPRQVEVALYSRGAFRYRDVMERLYPEADWLGGRLFSLSGDVRFLSWRAEPLRLTARIANDGPETAQLGVRQLDFPGWRAWLDGRPAPVEVAPRIPEQQAAPGFIVVGVPPGEHTVGIAFGPSPARLAGLAITLLTVLGGTGFALWNVRVTTAPRPNGDRPAGPKVDSPVVPRSTETPKTPLQRSLRRRGTALGWLALVALLPPALAGCLAWRGVRPMLGSQALLSVPDATPSEGVWRAPDLAGSRNGLLVNLAEAVRRDLAIVDSPSGSARGPDRFVDVRQLTISDEEDPERGIAATSRRQWLYLHPPSDVAVDVALPAGRHTWLQSALALDPAVWRVPTGDGVRFVAAVAPLN
ncbi:MAG: YfhO family protein, partial [Chloroflexota bacterium]|nr:YfhO family protein [Chloroflexota bacterium]